ncbi:MAG: hypothetical protein J2P30_25485 [Actinobacteria bacterium]|nr:hypothetical protein [Actinomycetota bacterium]
MGLPFSLRDSRPSPVVPNRSMRAPSKATSPGGIGTFRVARRVTACPA